MDRRILSLSHSHYTICSILYQYNTQNKCIFTTQIKSFFFSQHDLYTDQYSKHQTRWLMTLYNRGPGQLMLLYSSSPIFCIHLLYVVRSKLQSYLSDAPHIWTILLENVFISCFICMCVIVYFIIEHTLAFNI